jgi:predicted  nucleic acid-binding Zn-ribbon protein
MTRSRPLAHPTEAELRATLETLRQESAAARQRVLRLLAGGQDTAELRTEITALERRISDIGDALASLADEREHREGASTMSIAAALAKEATTRIAALMECLQPPSHPHKEGDND